MKITACIRCLTAEGPNEQHGTNKLLPEPAEKYRRGQKREERPAHDISANLPETLMLESILSERCVYHQEGPWVAPNMSMSRMTSQRQPGKLILFP